MMNHLLQVFQQNRKNVIKLLEEHSLEQVNAIPPGFNNNLIWNAGHLLLAQQYLMYYSSKLPLSVPVEEFGPKYNSGTKPDGQAAQSDLDQVIELLQTTSAKAVEDYHKGIFKTYNPYTSEYFGVSMKNIDEAIHFNTYHEAFHFGYMSAIGMALK